jgi:hypothetical protein
MDLASLFTNPYLWAFVVAFSVVGYSFKRTLLARVPLLNDKKSLIIQIKYLSEIILNTLKIIKIFIVF